MLDSLICMLIPKILFKFIQGGCFLLQKCHLNSKNELKRLGRTSEPTEFFFINVSDHKKLSVSKEKQKNRPSFNMQIQELNINTVLTPNLFFFHKSLIL